MDQITVIIPPQVYDDNKYCGIREMCYLKEALYNAGYRDLTVYGGGMTEIGDNLYRPKERFDCEVVEQAFIKGESITVTLIEQDN